MRKSQIAGLVAMAALAGVGMESSPASNQMTRQNAASETVYTNAQPAWRNRAPAPNQLASMMMAGFGGYGSRGHQRRSGPGWTQAQVQRRARKAKNVRRHRASLRG